MCRLIISNMFMIVFQAELGVGSSPHFCDILTRKQTWVFNVCNGSPGLTKPYYYIGARSY